MEIAAISSHYIANYIAGAVKRSSGKGCAKRILLLHLEQARARLAAMPPGLPGRDTADAMLTVLHAIARDNPRRLAGLTADGFCKALGFDRHPDTSAAAIRLLAILTPLVVRAGRFSWGCDLLAVRRLSPQDPRLAALEAWQPGDASPMCPQLRMERRPVPASDPAEPARDPGSDWGREYRERGSALVLVQHSAAEGQIFALEQDPGLGCASPAPAEQDSTRPDAPAASASDAPLTSSAWIQAVPRHRRQQQAAALLQIYPLERGSQDPLEAAKDLLRQRDSTEWQGRPAGHREVAAVARGLQGLQRRGLVGADFTPPRPARHLWLAILGVRERPGADRPSSKQAAYLRRCGIDPAGLSRAEARALGGALAKRREAVMAHPRMLARLIEAYGWADRLAEACAAGVIEAGLAGTLEWLRGLSMSAMLGLSRRGRMQ